MNELDLRAAGFVQQPDGSWKKTTKFTPKSKEVVKTRIRQQSKPLLNKLETEFFSYLQANRLMPPAIRPQAKRYKIGNGAWYKPDFTQAADAFDRSDWREHAWEVKGPSKMKGVAKGLLALKAAAHQWPEVRFVLAWKEDGKWFEQEVKP